MVFFFFFFSGGPFLGDGEVFFAKKLCIERPPLRRDWLYPRKNSRKPPLFMAQGPWKVLPQDKLLMTS